MTDPAKLLAVARPELLSAVKRASSSIWLASPFLSLDVARVLAEATGPSRELDLRLLTALDGRSVSAGVLAPKALRVLRNHGFAVGTIRNLHAKVALVDASWVLVGSGNLTNAGLGYQNDEAPQMNVELGVTLGPELTAQAVAMYERWWTVAEPVSNDLIDLYDSLPRWQSPWTRPLEAGPILAAPMNEKLEKVLAEDEAAEHGRGYWMKAAYYRPGQDEDGWWRRGWISDRKHPPYAVGDLVVLYLGGDGSPQSCPAVLEITAPPREDADFVEANGRGPEDRKYPHVTGTACLMDMPTEDAPRPEHFGIDSRSTQYGYRRLSREQFEGAAQTMIAIRAS